MGIAIAVLVLAVAACGDDRGRGTPAAATGDPSYGGTVVIAGSNDLDAANALVSAESYTQEFLRFVLFAPLLRYDEDLGYRPYLAESWELQGDTGVVFNLRDDVSWHDGRLTTAHDVAFTYQRARDPETGFANSAYFEKWGEVEVIDSFTVRFGFEPHPDPLAGWVFTPIMPRHHLDSVPPERLRQADFNTQPVGNGPFRFVSNRANDRWVFEANPDFPEGLGGRPYLDRLVWRVVPENSAQETEIQTGNVDLVIGPRSERVMQLDQQPGLRAIVKPSRKYAFIGWNGRRPPLDDARVRRALSMAIDRREILAVLREGFGELAAGPVPPYHWAHDPETEPLAFDPDAAAALLAEAGLRDRDDDGVLDTSSGDPFAVELKIPAGDDFNRDMAEMIRADLAEVGVEVSTRPTEMTTLIDDISTPARRFDAVILGMESDFRLNLRDPFHSEAIDGPFQLASYRNPAVDTLIDRLSATVDRSEARPLYRRIQEILRREQPWTFLYYYPDLYVMRERVGGVRMDIRGALVTVADWWVAAS